MNNVIAFREISVDDVPLFIEWADKEHIKETWPFEEYGSTPKKYILKKIEGDGYDYAFFIIIDERPVGYIQYCDLTAYRNICPDPKGVLIVEPEGTFCIDLFIGEEDYLGKGFGTRIMEEFCKLLLLKPEVQRLVIDPWIGNQRAIRCYEKVGFKRVREEFDGARQVLIMEKVKE